MLTSNLTDKPIMNENQLKAVLSLIPIVTGLLYVTGGMYFEGYLSAFNLSGSQFSIDTTRTLFYGYTHLLTSGWIVWLLFFVATFFLLFLVVVGRVLLASYPKFSQWFKNRRDQSIAFNAKRMYGVPGQALENRVYRMSVWAGVLFFAMTVLYAVTFLARQAGTEQARSQIKTFAATKGNYVSVEVDAVKGTDKALQLVCNGTHCAFWLGDRTIILKFDQIKLVESFVPDTLNAIHRHP